MRLETMAIHVGYEPEPTTKAVAVPIYQTTAYAFDNTQHGADLFDLKVDGKHLHPHHEPDARGAGTTARRDGGRGGRARALLRPGGDDLLDPHHRRGGRQRHQHLDPLRRHLQPVRPHPAAARHRDPLRRSERPRRHREPDRREDEGGLLRIDREPRGQRRRSRGHRRGGPRPRRAGHRRQHRAHALPLPSRSSMDATSSSTRSRSTSAGTAPSSAG